MQKSQDKKKHRKGQTQRRPGTEAKMEPRPEYEPYVKPSDKLKRKIALITGGDSGIGRAVAVRFAQEGAEVAIVYLNEKTDAQETKQVIEKMGRKCLLLEGDITTSKFCEDAVKQTLQKFGSLHIVVNNAATQVVQESLVDITDEQLERTFATNILSMFRILRYALPHLKRGACIINTTSVTAYRGSSHLIDYAATKGAIVSFTRSLSSNLVDKGIRVNAVAPGPVWTPLIVSSFDKKQVATFGSDCPMGRAGEPAEIAGCYVFLASDDATFMTGQVLHPNGGEIING
jgi:NAD(P)-dependent dehydrogenase (short-subunit alcohol dehydrogenase family)